VLRNAGRFAFRVSLIVLKPNHSDAWEVQIGIALRLILRFSFRMIRASKSGSKLCVVIPPRPAIVSAPTARQIAQLGKGQAPLHPLCRLVRQMEPWPGSKPPAVRA